MGGPWLAALFLLSLAVEIAGSLSATWITGEALQMVGQPLDASSKQFSQMGLVFFGAAL